MATDGVYDEALTRLHRTGPEWGESVLTNHGPMAVEVMLRHGHPDEVDGWVDRYMRRLDELPAPTAPITEANWREALGDGARVGDWTAYFARRLEERPWHEVLVTWWPRLLPGIAAGATHGVIRVGHALRALLGATTGRQTTDGGDPEGTPETRLELGHGLAFWAARSTVLPVEADPTGTSDPAAAFDALPRIPDQQGSVANRVGQLAGLADWRRTVDTLRPAATAEQVPERLADLVAAATARYLSYGHASPVLLVHTATAPNAVLHSLPALPKQLWQPSLAAVWTVTAAVYSAYAPARPRPRDTITAGAHEDAMDRAVAHGDEHVIKFTDTAMEVFNRTGDPEVLVAAAYVGELLS